MSRRGANEQITECVLQNRGPRRDQGKLIEVNYGEIKRPSDLQVVEACVFKSVGTGEPGRGAWGGWEGKEVGPGEE